MLLIPAQTSPPSRVNFSKTRLFLFSRIELARGLSAHVSDSFDIIDRFGPRVAPLNPEINGN